MRLVKLGEVLVNPEYVTEVARVFYSHEWEVDERKYAESKIGFDNAPDFDTRNRYHALIQEEFPQGPPVKENYWVTKVSLTNGNEHYVAKSLEEVEALLVG